MRKRLTGESEFSDGVEYALFANESARCVAIVNPLWQQSQDEPQTGHVGWFAAAPDAAQTPARYSMRPRTGSAGAGWRA